MKNTKSKGLSNAGLAILSVGLILSTGIIGAGNFFFNGMVERLDSRLTDTEARIAFLGEEHEKAKIQAAFDRELDREGQANATRDDRIEGLFTQIRSLEAEVTSLKAKIGDLQKEVADVRTKLASEGQVVDCADPYDECLMPAVPLPERGSD